MLPQEFLNRMEHLLGEEYPAFLESYEKEKHQALRINPVKGEWTKIKGQLPFSLRFIPWERHGFCYDREDTPGKHPYHEAGMYYIQEPSAMAPVSYLMEDVAEAVCGAKEATKGNTNERILDLCAAPGGKSTQIAGWMYEAYQNGIWDNPGLLISNEIHPARAKILSENVERMGICNTMVTNETPAHLAEIFEQYFTRILVDAPCSGEGMFRKNEEASEEWSLENVALCAKRQDEILECAASMLAPGGKLVYSTCTFAPEENEGSIARFLSRHQEFFVEEVRLAEGMSAGVPGWAYLENEVHSGEVQRLSQERLETLKKTIRLFPHKIDGEGHYLAVLRKEGEPAQKYQGYCRNGLEKGMTEKEKNSTGKGCLEFLEFAKETLQAEWDKLGGVYLKFGDQLYLAPEGMPAVKGLKVLRPGLHLGTIKKNRFEPSHALALALKPEAVRKTKDFPADSSEITTYLNGGTFPAEGEKGWYLLTVDGYSIGWGKLAGGIMKNHYPKGLRKN